MPIPDTNLDLAQSRIALAALDPDAVVLCASQRLARNLRRDHDRAQLARGLTRWRPLRALAPTPWLEAVVNEALLAGEIAVAAAPRLLLSDLRLLECELRRCAYRWECMDNWAMFCRSHTAWRRLLSESAGSACGQAHFECSISQ